MVKRVPECNLTFYVTGFFTATETWWNKQWWILPRIDKWRWFVL